MFVFSFISIVFFLIVLRKFVGDFFLDVFIVDCVCVGVC